MASWTFEFHTAPNTRVTTDYFQKDEDHPAFAVIHIGDVMADARLYIQSPDFCARLIRELEIVQAQVMLQEIVEEEIEGEPTCP